MAEQLIPVFVAVINEQPEQLCNARDLHATLQVGKVFAAWITERIAAYGFIQNEDYVVVSNSGKNASNNCFPNSESKKTNDDCSPNSGGKKSGRGGHNKIDYHLTLDMAKELAMVENNEMGRKVRRYFIDIEREAKKAGIELPLYVTPAQQRQLQDAIAKRFPDGKQRSYAWSRFNRHFKLGGYKQLPADQCDEALAYIAQMLDSRGEPPLSELALALQERLMSMRFCLSFGQDGRLILKEISSDARIVADEDFAKIIRDPNYMVDRALLPEIISAAADRLKK